MDELKLKHLLARHSTRDMDKLEFTRRVQAEHLFLSVDEAFEYLNRIVDNKPFNPDDISFSNHAQSPIIMINVIDEAICSIVYEIYQQIYRKDNDMLAYFRNRITEFRDKLMNLESWRLSFQDELFTVIMMLDFLSFPVYHREETLPHQLAYSYYTLMSNLYKNATPSDDYFTTLYKYYESKRHS